MKLVLALLPLTLAAQVAIPNGAPASYNFDGRVSEWTALTPTIALSPSSAGGRKGSVWIRQIPEGLLIAGGVDGAAPDFATSAADAARKDRVEIWLAPSALPVFPAIGYDNQEHEVPGIESCQEEKCRTWFQSVVVHRERMQRVFVRQYEMAPGWVRETAAKPAYDQMSAAIEERLRDNVAPIAPSGVPVFRAAPGDRAGYSFEVLLGWDAFPPLSTLRLDQIQLRVDVLSGNARSSTSAIMARFDEGRHFHVTACGYPLDGRNIRGEHGPGFFYPRMEDDVLRVFRLTNYESFYSYDLSPIVETSEYAEKQMPGDAVVCGPSLAIARNGTVERYTLEVDAATLDVKLEPDGSYMVLSGPAWKRASLQDEDGCCEGTPMIHYHIWLISPERKVRQIFETHTLMSGTALGVVDMDVEASPDAKRVTSYLAMFSQVDKEAHWSSTTFCRQGLAYKQCGSKSEVKPPKRKAESSKGQ